MNSAARIILAIVGSISALSIVSVVLSQKANTSGVIGAASAGFGGLLTAAEAPING